MLLSSERQSKFLDASEIERDHSSKACKFKIVVITYNRLQSLLRLLNSLDRAHYTGRVDLSISIEAGAPADVVHLIEKFNWQHGSKTLHVRVVKAGLVAAIVESWYPSHDNEVGIILEDDLEVSPYYFEWLLSATTIALASNMRHRIFGISLYTPRVIETTNPYRIFLPDKAFPKFSVFLQQLPCSWGGAYFPTPWKMFVRYMHHRLTTNGTMLVPGSRTNGWTNSWKKFFIEMAWAEALFMLYPNYKNQTSFTTNYLEPGAHIKANDVLHTRDLYTVPLHTSQVFLTLNDLSAVPMVDPLGHALGEHGSTEQAWEHCHQISSGFAGLRSGSSLITRPSAGNKLSCGYILPAGSKLVSIPHNGRYFTASVTEVGVLIIEECLLDEIIAKGCSIVTQLGSEINLADLSLYIDVTGRLAVSPYVCSAAGCGLLTTTKITLTDVPSKPENCHTFVLHLQRNGLLALHCGCGCHGYDPIWVSGAGSYQPVTCSTPDSAQSALIPSSNLSSLHLNTLLSDETEHGHYTEAVMQADGNFVLYLNPSPNIHAVFSIPMNVQAEYYEFHVSMDGNLNILGHRKQQQLLLWDNNFHGVEGIPHFLVVTHCGTLSVYEGYGACEHGKLAWASAHCSNFSPKCLNPAAAQRHAMCSHFSPDVYSFFSRENLFTVILHASSGGLSHLLNLVRYLSLHHQVACILIVLYEPFLPVMRPFFENGKLVEVLSTFTDSPNNHFFPSIHISTEAVLLLDDGISVYYSDLDLLFNTWMHHKSNIVTLSFPDDDGGFIPLTQVSMLSKKFIYQYACIVEQVLPELSKSCLHCGDFALHMLASMVANGTPSLRVTPSHALFDHAERLRRVTLRQNNFCLKCSSAGVWH